MESALLYILLVLCIFVRIEQHPGKMNRTLLARRPTETDEFGSLRTQKYYLTALERVKNFHNREARAKLSNATCSMSISFFQSESDCLQLYLSKGFFHVGLGDTITQKEIIYTIAQFSVGGKAGCSARLGVYGVVMEVQEGSMLCCYLPGPRHTVASHCQISSFGRRNGIESSLGIAVFMEAVANMSELL